VNKFFAEPDLRMEEKLEQIRENYNALACYESWFRFPGTIDRVSLYKRDMSGNSLRSHPDLHNDENVGDNR
jgi:hypothetical protein